VEHQAVKTAIKRLAFALAIAVPSFAVTLPPAVAKPHNPTSQTDARGGKAKSQHAKGKKKSGSAKAKGKGKRAPTVAS
jgi:hypothetical protein